MTALMPNRPALYVTRSHVTGLCLIFSLALAFLVSVVLASYPHNFITLELQHALLLTQKFSILHISELFLGIYPFATLHSPLALFYT